MLFVFDGLYPEWRYADEIEPLTGLRDVVMEEWKRTPVATCEGLVYSMPKSVKAML